MKSKNTFDAWFLLNWKKFGLLVLIWIGAVVFHNFYFAVFNYEEAVFFILAVFIVPIYFLVMIVYSILIKI